MAPATPAQIEITAGRHRTARISGKLFQEKLSMLEKLTKPIASAFTALTGGSAGVSEADYEAAAREKNSRSIPATIKSRVLTGNGLPPDRAGECLPAQPIVAPTPTPDAPPELAAAEKALAFLINEWNQGQALMAKFPRSSSTPLPDQWIRGKQYRESLTEGRSLVGEPSTDLALLLTVLQSSLADGHGGLIGETAAKVNTLKGAICKKARTAEDQQFIVAERKALKAWAKLHNARRQHERGLPVALHSKLQSVRPPFGMNHLQYSEPELDKLAAFAANLAEE
jgi:hypothetical protein